MARYDSRSPPRQRSRRSPSPDRQRYQESSRRRDRSPHAPKRRPRSPPVDRERRPSPSYREERRREPQPVARWQHDGDLDLDKDLQGLPLLEMRALKRQRLAERMVNCIWRNTPSPPPEPRTAERRSSDEEAHTAAELSSGASGSGSDEQEEAPRMRKRKAGPKPAAPVPGVAPAGSSGSDQEAAALPMPAPEVGADERAEHELAHGTAASTEARMLEAAGLGDQQAILDTEELGLLRMWMTEKRDAEAAAEAARREAEAAEVMVGPEAPDDDSRKAPGSYGGALLPGEGQAMAAFVQSGKRIPRRGEVGLSADQIEHFETLGYVMSGSRHSRMNAIRIRKENQVYSAEEKAALAMYNFEENKRKESKILSDMQLLVERTLGDKEEVAIGPAEASAPATVDSG